MKLLTEIVQREAPQRVRSELKPGETKVRKLWPHRLMMAPQGTGEMYEAVEGKDAKVEELAGYAHKAWAGWMRYLFAKSKKNENGTVTIPASLVERWERQCTTRYKKLPATEQLSDRYEARAMLTIMEAHE